MADKLMRTFIVMSFFMVMALFSGCGAKGANLNETDNGKQITVKPGDVITLTLNSNPTTGYSWHVMEIDNAILAQQGDPEYKQASGTEGLVGAGGTETFHFKASGAGSVTLKLGYMRPWESVPPIETFSVQVIVQ
jgi:inhibitor of cysteine peptidase